MDPASQVTLWVVFFICVTIVTAIVSICITLRYSDYLRDFLKSWSQSKVEIAKLKYEADIKKAELESGYWREISGITNKDKEKT